MKQYEVLTLIMPSSHGVNDPQVLFAQPSHNPGPGTLSHSPGPRLPPWSHHLHPWMVQWPLASSPASVLALLLSLPLQQPGDPVRLRAEPSLLCFVPVVPASLGDSLSCWWPQPCDLQPTPFTTPPRPGAPSWTRTLSMFLPQA